MRLDMIIHLFHLMKNTTLTRLIQKMQLHVKRQCHKMAALLRTTLT